MSLSFLVNRQFLDQLYKKDLQAPQGFTATNESCFIHRRKFSFGIPIQILNTNNIFQYF